MIVFRPLLRTLVFPGPGQELMDSLGRMILQAREHIGKPGLRIGVVELGGLDMQRRPSSRKRVSATQRVRQ